ncbi:hypothetical protein IAQ61_005546 [Plenodomus lingam]|uniref:uncharacterized protein n=1 Tax=Leptosphaeria maculans TaxID=5022 RepID=UPI0033190F39|nr:hypothetical protein IAQ61_005546 [Plenodomus lingam]
MFASGPRPTALTQRTTLKAGTNTVCMSQCPLDIDTGVKLLQPYVMFDSNEDLASYSEGTFGTPTRARTRTYPSDHDLDLYLTHDDLEILRHPSAAILKLQDPNLKCSRNLGWSMDWAVAFVVNHPTAPDAADAFRSIRTRAADLESAGLLCEIPYRIFHKLHGILFAGHPHNPVFHNTHDLCLDVSGATYNHGWGTRSAYQAHLVHHTLPLCASWPVFLRDTVQVRPLSPHCLWSMGYGCEGGNFSLSNPSFLLPMRLYWLVSSPHGLQT